MDNIGGIIAGHDPTTTALVSDGLATTYGELQQQVANLRGGLIGLGVGRGDRVALIAQNGRDFVVGYLATVGIGAVAVPLNPTSPANELRRELALVGAVVAIVEPSARPNVDAIDRAALPNLRRVVDIQELEVLLRHEPAPMADVGADDLAVLIFTSGTAGAPRAAMLTHANLLASIRAGHVLPGHLTPADVVFAVLPPFHIFGLNVTIGATLSAGACAVLAQRFDPSTAADIIRERGVTVVPGAPPLWQTFAQVPDLPADTFAGVRLALSGAAKLPDQVAEVMAERFGVTVREGYGLTEAAPVVTTSVGIDARRGSVGKVVAGVEVRLVDEEGADALVGDTGEIWVSGPNVFPGYLDDPAATARVLAEVDGTRWLRTGDLAVADDDGYLYLVDRAKDLVIVSGFNVHPAEVEEVLGMCPGVEQAAVIGVPHPHTGEAVKAYVVAEPGAHLDDDTLIEFCLDHLARYKVPGEIVFVDELPRTLAGKLLRRELT
jgi:long-chain acyl-CoA synthetase